MEIFLVRHGETDGNVARRHQVEKTPLTSVGRAQAKAAAAKLAQHDPTHLVTSTLVRALQTASVLGDELELVPETNPHFIELARPKSMYGYHHRDPRSLLFYIRWYFGSQQAIQEGGESYRTLRERIVAARATLEQYPDDARVVVVTHSVFMTLFVAHLCNDRPLAPLAAMRAFLKILTTPNAHIVSIIFTKRTTDTACQWSIG